MANKRIDKEQTINENKDTVIDDLNGLNDTILDETILDEIEVLSLDDIADLGLY